MWILHFYRLYCALLLGAFFYFFITSNVWLALLITIALRLIWFFIERTVKHYRINREFTTHIAAFKQQYGPYGIRIANKAQEQWKIKKSLAEVFTADRKHLQKSVESLEMMDTLFNAGLRPEGDEYLLHDLKLKYGKFRLEHDKK